MAATLIGEQFAGRKTRYLKDFTREHTRVFTVVTTLNADDGTVVAAATGVPVRGSIHPNDAYAHCTDVEPTNETDDPNQWTVTCQYSTSMDDWQVSPTSKPTIYDWSTEYVDKAVAEDLDGYTIYNSAHETFDPPASVRVPIVVTKATNTWSSYVPATDYDPFVQHVNSDTVTVGYRTWLPGQLLLEDLHIAMVEELGAFYYRREYTFRGRTDLGAKLAVLLTQNVTANVVAQVVTVDSTDAMTVGAYVQVYYGGLVTFETVQITAINPGVSFTGVFAQNHVIGDVCTVDEFQPWQYRPLDMGFNTWDSVNSVNREIFTRDGSPVAHPVLLDGSGQRLVAGSPPVRLYFRLIPSVAMSSLIASFP